MQRADELLADWEQRSLLAVISHARSANRCATWDARLGSGATALTAIVGTSIFATLQDNVSITSRMVVGCLTIAAAVATAVLTFAALPQRKEAYERASRRHASVRRRIEVLRCRLAAGDESDIWTEIALIREELDAAGGGTPNASRRVWDRTRRHLNGDFTWWERVGRRAEGYHHRDGSAYPDHLAGHGRSLARKSSPIR